jgi:hypothetical protein
VTFDTQRLEGSRFGMRPENPVRFVSGASVS